MRENGSLRVLVTAGNTQTPIDRVRCITNIFSGRTGAMIAAEGMRRGHVVTVLTSHPEVLDSISPASRVKRYRTFDDLESLLATELTQVKYDVLIHAAAVSDYAFAGVYTPNSQTGEMTDVYAGKVKSHHPELWLKLVQTPKLADRVREPWGFAGVFVKFKLEVGLGDEELIRVAERSRIQSDADLMVANTLDEMAAKAFIGARDGQYQLVERHHLATSLWDKIAAVRAG